MESRRISGCLPFLPRFPSPTVADNLPLLSFIFPLPALSKQVAARRLVDRSLFKTRTAVSLAEELIRTKQRDFEAFRVELARIEEARRRAEAVAAEVEKARREKPLE